MDSLHELLRAAPCRLRTCEDGKRRKIGASVEPAQKSAPCELRGARCDRRNGTACATVCELRTVPCELQSCLSTCLASMLRAAICELRLATGPQLADCGSRIAARGFAARPSSSVDTMRTCLASILRAAICDVHLADGLQLADCGSQIRMQSDSPVHSPGHNDATCDVRRAVCDVADGGLSIALGTMMRRATCDVQSATADDCKLRVAACRMRPSGTMSNGLLRTFSDS